MWSPLATPLNSRGSGTRFHVVTSFLFRSSSAGEISQQRHGSCPQFPSIFITLAVAGSGVPMNVSKSDEPERQPIVSQGPKARRRTISDEGDVIARNLCERRALPRQEPVRRPAPS